MKRDYISEMLYVVFSISAVAGVALVIFLVAGRLHEDTHYYHEAVQGSQRYVIKTEEVKNGLEVSSIKVNKKTGSPLLIKEDKYCILTNKGEVCGKKELSIYLTGMSYYDDEGNKLKRPIKYSERVFSIGTNMFVPPPP